MTKSKTLLIFCLAFIFGVFIGRYINFHTIGVLAMILIIVASLGYKNKLVLIFCLAGIFVLLGSIRFITDYARNDIISFYDKQISMTGIIVDEPDVRSDKTFLTVKVEDLKSKILIRVSRFPEYEYGDKITFEGRILEPKEFEGFSYKDYLSRFGIDAVVYDPKISHVEKGFGNPLKAKLLQFKKSFVQRLEKLFPEPHNSFLAGILIGQRKTIPENLSNALSITGTTHIIAISGFNITIIASVIDGLLLYFFSRRISFVLAVIAIFLFVVLVGASASAVRAGIMGILGMLALNLGRVNSINNALALTAAVMLMINPQILHFDLGFLLSFAALMGLVYLGPILSEYFSRIPKIINTYLVPSTAAYFTTLPISLNYFDRLSIVAIPVNVLILWVIPMAMLFGFVSGILVYPFVWLTWGLLTYVLIVVEFASEIPFASINFHINWWIGLIYYFALGTFIIWKSRPNSFSNI